MFAVSVDGLRELEGGRAPWRLAAEPVVNAFDEFRRREPDRRPRRCVVNLSKSTKPRGVLLTVEDDGPGFDRIEDVWTLFGSTEKRDNPDVSGRFNFGEKQLIATAIESTVASNEYLVEFASGKRTVRRVGERRAGVLVSAVLPWLVADIEATIERLQSMRPPEGLEFVVNGTRVEALPAKARVTVTLPTVRMVDGVLRDSTRRCVVDVLQPSASGGLLMELGVPVAELTEIGFPWTLDVGQKIPLPTSRDAVSPAYLHRLIGVVIEAAAMDGVRLLGEEQQGAGFLKDSLDWVREPEALAVAVAHVYGDSAVRVSSDPLANAEAVAAGCTLVSGRHFTTETRIRLDKVRAMPVSSMKFGGTPAARERLEDERRRGVCDRCGKPL